MKKNKMFKCLVIALAVASLSPAAMSADLTGKSGGNARFHGGDEILLQGFHWNSARMFNGQWYNKLNTMTDQTGNNIKDLGVTSIWMPPPWRDWSSWSDAATGKSGGGEGYFWHDWNLNSQYGTAAQLQTAAAKLLSNGIKPIYDIVPNHRNYKVWNAENQYTYPGPKWRNGGGDEGNPFMSGDSDLNTGNSLVWNDINNALLTLKNTYSAQGFRFDFVHGYSTGSTNAWMQNSIDSGFCVGEYWKDPDTQTQLKNWSTAANCTAFDFALKAQIATGEVRNFVKGLNANPSTDWRERAVTFVDNHDTGYSPGLNGGQHHYAAPDAIRDKSYAYILTSPGTPSVYWPDVFDWGRYDFIKTLIAVRKDAKVYAYSDIKFCINSSDVGSGQLCARNNTQDGLVYVVNKGNTWGGKKLVVAIGSSMTDPNTVEDGTFSVVAQGAWGKVWAESSTVCTTNCGGTPVTSDPQRTMIMVYAQTSSGQDMFVRGGIDSAWNLANRGVACTQANKECALGHSIRNRLNNYTASWKSGDTYMDWYGIETGQGAGAEGTAFDWTTNDVTNYVAAKDRDGVAPTGYLDSGFGYYAANTFGPHYWIYDATVDCKNAVEVTGSAGTKLKLFEFKAYVKNGAGWESNIDTNSFTFNGETFNVYNTSSNNHFAVCGKFTKTLFSSNTMNVYTLPAQ